MEEGSRGPVGRSAIRRAYSFSNPSRPTSAAPKSEAFSSEFRKHHPSHVMKDGRAQMLRSRSFSSIPPIRPFTAEEVHGRAASRALSPEDSHQAGHPEGVRYRFQFEKKLPATGHFDTYCAWDKGQPELDTTPLSRGMRPMIRLNYVLKQPKDHMRQASELYEQLQKNSEVDIDELSKFVSTLVAGGHPHVFRGGP